MDNGYIADDFISVDGATVAEDLFVELFVETYGLDKVQYLVNEYPLQDIYGGYRYIDYALKTVSGKIALEIDGELGHNPIFFVALTSIRMICLKGIVLFIMVGNYLSGHIGNWLIIGNR
jgi:hypothetical protein